MGISRNLSVLRFHQFFFNFYPIAALLVVYFHQITQSYTEAMAVFSFISATRSVAEIPAGILTDRIGCRKALMLVSLLSFICYALWILSGEQNKGGLLFVGAVFLGIAKALYSGTTEALIFRTTKELEQNGTSKSYNEVYAKSNIYAQAGLAVSALLAAAISYYYNLMVLMYMTLGSLLMQLAVVACFIEPEFKQKRINIWLDFRLAWRLLWKNKMLKVFVFVSVLNNSVERAINNFEAAYFKLMVTDWVINILRFIKQFIGAIGFALIAKQQKYQNIHIYELAVSFNSIFRSIAVILNCIVSPFLMVFTNIFYGAFSTASTSILQHEFSNRWRRTMQAFVSFVGGIAEVIVLTMFGVLADSISPQIAILFAVIANISVLIFGRIMQRMINN